MGQAQTVSRNMGQTHRQYPSIRQQSIYSKRIEHEGLLTLRPIPFKNCIQIQTESGSIFLQSIEITLKDLLDSRMYTNKLFPKEDIERLIENVTYTLAYLAENNTPYKDISPQNIFYDDGVFKLLPNELIQQSRYQRFLTNRHSKKPLTPATQSHHEMQNEFTPISPQMIIAYRCKQPSITELDILDKSNVFCLGLILLETCTLLPSTECYDEDTCDILDQVIIERIELVKEYYSEEIASIVANMLDYDYSERMGLKEMSIFVNRELNRDLITNSKIVKELSNKKSSKQNKFFDVPPSSDPTVDDAESVVNHSHTKSAISKSRLEQTEEADSRISRPSHNISVSEKKRNKTNRVYMNGGVQPEPEEETVTVPNPKEERNKIYMKNSQPQQQPESKRILEQQERNHGVLKSIPNANNALRQTNDNKILPSSGKVLNFSVREKYAPPLPAFSQKRGKYQVNNEEEEENRYPRQDDFSQQRQMRRKNSTDYLGYRATNQPRTPKQQKPFYQGPSQNRFDSGDQYNEQQSFNNQGSFCRNNDSMKEDSDFMYPQQRKEGAFGQRFVQKESPMNEDSGSRGYFEANRPGNMRQNVDFKDHDNSLNRIKSEIQRSRKLIEEFKRGENVQFS